MPDVKRRRTTGQQKRGLRQGPKALRGPGLAKPPYPQRAVHLIDVENLAGCPVPDLARVREVRDRYVSCVGFGPIDQVVIACNHLAMGPTIFGWPRARYLIRSGRNGADTELINVLAHEDIAARFSRVVIASGDGIFSSQAVALGTLGCQVTVVSRRAALSRSLMHAAHQLIYLDGLDQQAAFAQPAEPELPSAA